MITCLVYNPIGVSLITGLEYGLEQWNGLWVLCTADVTGYLLRNEAVQSA